MNRDLNSTAKKGYWNDRKQPFNPLGTNYGTMPRCEQDDAETEQSDNDTQPAQTDDSAGV